MSDKEFLYLELLGFSRDARLSRNLGNDLLKLLRKFSDQKQPDVHIPKDWKTIKTLEEKLIKPETFIHKKIYFPANWNMAKWTQGTIKPYVEMIARNPLHMAARLLMRPDLIYGYSDCIQLDAFEKVDTETRETTWGSVMSSRWAQETQRELRQRSKNGHILGFIFNSDAVAMGATNQSATTVLGTLANFDDTLQSKPISKICFGYLPTLHVSEEELMNHLMTKADMIKERAKAAISIFKKHMERGYWEMVLDPIKKTNQSGSISCIPNLIL